MSTAEAPGTSGLMIPVRWAGADEFGGAGLRGYNVEMREGSGAWSRWLTETTQTNADFPGEDGKQYSFRVQGVDRVGNAGAWLETAAVTTNAVTKYYALSGQRVAMRQGSAVYYLYGDHLGSTSLVTDATGATLTETRYEPYGQPYWQWGATRTDFGFTGQRLDGFGLMDYNARYYSSTLGRFVSPDTYVPENQGVQAWDRYAYTNNNPINYTDPSGHCIWDLCIMEGVGLVEVSLVVLTAITAAWYSNPDIRESGMNAIETSINQVENSIGQTAEQLRSFAKATGPKPLTPDEQEKVDHLLNDLDGFTEEHPDLASEAKKKANGEIGEYDHVGEAEEFMRGVQNSINHLEKVWKNRTEEGQEAINNAIEQAKSWLERMNDILTGKNE